MSYTPSGSMRDRITVEQFQSSDDGQGGKTAGSWVPFLKAWSKITPLVGQARLMAMNEGTENPTKINLRFRDGITPKMRVNYFGRIFSIVQVLNLDNADVETELQCSEVTG